MTIDITKPLELVDGTPVELAGRVDDSLILVNTLGYRGYGLGRAFRWDGKHITGELPDLRNVIEKPQGVMVMPRTADEWEEFAGVSPDKYRTLYLDVLGALGLVLPDEPKSHVSSAQRFEEGAENMHLETLRAALKWFLKDPE